jgi:diguanylate cyclase (GGDEF)-like protein
VVEDLQSRNGTFCNGDRIETRPLADGDKIQVGRTTILKFTYHDNFDDSFQRQMYDSALRDGLTKAFNKRYFDDRLNSEFRFAERHQVPLNLLLLDLDHFKRVNDEHGHIAGDHVLRSFAAAVQDSVRNEDVFARYGGEEFAVITRAISREDARKFGERLRALVEKLEVVHEGTTIPITVSIGIAGLPENQAESPTDLIAAADRALYHAKAEGRNRVALASDSDADADQTAPV